MREYGDGFRVTKLKARTDSPTRALKRLKLGNLLGGPLMGEANLVPAFYLKLTEGFQENCMAYNLEEINDNQAQINFLLVAVDQRVISTLREILRVLKTLPHLKDVDFIALGKALDEAEPASKRVADITPPGCQEPPPPPPPRPPGGGQYPL